MIRVDDLPDVQQTPIEGKKVEVELLNEEESAVLGYIDAEIDEAIKSLVGDMFVAPIPRTMAPARVVSALKKNWEAGGWIVGAFEVVDGWQVVFVRPRQQSSNAKVISALRQRDEARVEASAPAKWSWEKPYAPKTSRGLLLRMPTRGRSAQALKVLAAYRALAEEHVSIEVLIDEDDEQMNNTQVLQRLCALECFITIGRHKNKIDAVNGGRLDDWSILALISDDMVPVVKGYDRLIVGAMDMLFPLLDGAIYFDDGYNKDHVRPGRPVLCTLPIMGRHLWEQFGYVYHPEYGSLYSDDEQTELLTQMRRLQFVDQQIIEHRHHAAGKATFDGLYKFNDDKYGSADRELFEKRSKMKRPGAQFAFDSPPMLLSVLICSTRKRADMLKRLVENLRWQMRDFPRQVELCVEIDDGEMSVGEKRQRLLERAVAEYVAFIDDDDWVSHDYVIRIVKALATRPDCLSLVGVMTTNGENPQRFEHSIRYEQWRTVTLSNGQVLHERSPNHLSVVKRELALKVGFVSKNVGEDHDFSTRLKPLLKSEGSTGEDPLYYYWFVPSRSVQGAAQ